MLFACAFTLSSVDDVVIQRKGIRLRGVPFYLDMQATTPLDPRVLDAMLPYQTECYGNPHSRTHLYGWESEDAIERAREQVLAVFTSLTKAHTTYTGGVVDRCQRQRDHFHIRRDGE